MVAIKVSKQNAFNDRDGIQFYALRELMILQKLQSCKAVVRLVDSFVHEGQVCIVMEYLSMESNQAHISQFLAGLQEIHDSEVCHRDIKPSNVRIDTGGQLKFIDFGISKVMEKQNNSTQQHTKNCVTRCYRPPEIFFGDRTYTQKVDIWSAACVIFELVTGKILFLGTGDLEVLCNIFDIRGTPKLEEWPECESLPCYLPFNDCEPKTMLPDDKISPKLNELLK